MVTCPKDGHSTCSIIEGHPTISLNGKPVAFHGCHTACGAALISTASGKHGLG
ncbi:PAAR domain-containing protein [Cobetia marina]